MEADVVIVGAGAAGCLFAAKLAAAGRRVLVLEAGPAWSQGDLISSQIWSRRLKWGGPPVLSRAVTGHNSSFGWGFGGSALHHYGTWPRPTVETFHLRTLTGEGLDWPIQYDVLRPFYDRIQTEMGLSGDARAEAAWRPPGADYPMPPMPTFRHGELLRAGFERLNMPVAPLPALINTVWYDNRPPCLYDGWCDAGCPIGALGHPLAVHMPIALSKGAEFEAHCTVTRIEHDGRKATGVVFADQTGAVRRAKGRVVVLAASVIQNPRLLLCSAGSGHDEGLANRSGLVGAYLTIEPSAHVFGLFGEDTDVHRGVSAGQLIHRQPYRTAGRERPVGAYQWQIAPVMKPNDIFGVAFTRPDLHGAALDAFIKTASRRMASMAGFGADTPQQQNRVALSAERDRFGTQLPTVSHTLSPHGEALRSHMALEGVALLRAAGAIEAWAGPPAPGHMTGGTIMGDDPDHSVTDSFGRAHDIDNLFIAGGGLLPTNGGTSPTFTLTALALRAVEHLIDHWSDYAA